MKKTIFTLSLSVLVFTPIISSCKKSDSPTSGGPATTSSTTITGNGNPSGTFNGILYYGYEVNGSMSLYVGAADFFNSPVSFNPSTQAVATATVNSVSLNSNQLPYNSSNNNYSSFTTTSLGFPPAAWVVNGAGIIPSFTYTNTNAMPTFTGLSSFPSSVSRSQNLVIPIIGASGCDQIQVQVNDSTNKTTSIYVAGGSTSVTILKDSLTKLNNCMSGSISISLIKYNQQTLGGKSFLFGTVYITGKNNVVLKQ
jgi:hypothetical protein